MFLEFGYSPAEAKEKATALFDGVKKEMLSRSPGFDLYDATHGPIHARNQSHMAPRLEAGLTCHDVEYYWNQPVVVVLCEMKMIEMVNFIAIDTARQLGQDLGECAQRYRRVTPRYGDPMKWDPSAYFNKDFRECDADIYCEFVSRVRAWQSKTPGHEVACLVIEYGTFNAMVRHLVSDELL